MNYGIVHSAPATASVPHVPGSESDEETSNHCSSSSAALYSVTTNCCNHTQYAAAECRICHGIQADIISINLVCQLVAEQSISFSYSN